jgi:hypothetical protein
VSADDTSASDIFLPSCPQWLDRFVAVLAQVPSQLGQADASAVELSMVSMEMVRSLTLLLEKFPKDMVRFVPQLLPVVWALFSGCLPAYAALLSGGDAFEDAPAVFDADGDQV